MVLLNLWLTVQKEVWVLLHADLARGRRERLVHPEPGEEEQVLRDEDHEGVVEEACAEGGVAAWRDLCVCLAG